MTSVRNHRLLLSGNKHFVLGFCLSMLLLACKATAPPPTSEQPTEVRPEKAKTTTVSVKKPEEPAIKPLQLELRLPLTEEGLADHLLFDRLQVLEGFLVGFDSLQRRGLPLKVQVVNTVKVDTLAISTAPLIIEYESEVYRIYLASESRWFESRPPMEMHTAKIARYAKKENAVVLALTKQTELEIRILSALQEQHNGVRVMDKKQPSKAEIKSKLVKGRKNLVYVPTPDENFAIYCLKLLSELKEEFKIEVFGLPNWVNFPTIDPELYAQLPVFVTSSTAVSFNHPNSQRFQELFKSKFAGEPQTAAFIAFDHALYIGERWLEHQKWRLTTFKENSTQLAQDFNFFEVDDQLINRAVRLLEYRDYQFKPIP